MGRGFAVVPQLLVHVCVFSQPERSSSRQFSLQMILVCVTTDLIVVK